MGVALAAPRRSCSPAAGRGGGGDGRSEPPPPDRLTVTLEPRGRLVSRCARLRGRRSGHLRGDPRGARRGARRRHVHAPAATGWRILVRGTIDGRGGRRGDRRRTDARRGCTTGSGPPWRRRHEPGLDHRGRLGEVADHRVSGRELIRAVRARRHGHAAGAARPRAGDVAGVSPTTTPAALRPRPRGPRDRQPGRHGARGPTRTPHRPREPVAEPRAGHLGPRDRLEVAGEEPQLAPAVRPRAAAAPGRRPGGRPSRSRGTGPRRAPIGAGIASVMAASPIPWRRTPGARSPGRCALGAGSPPRRPRARGRRGRPPWPARAPRRAPGACRGAACRRCRAAPARCRRA